MQTKPSWTTVCKTEEPTGDCVGNDNVPHILKPCPGLFIPTHFPDLGSS